MGPTHHMYTQTPTAHSKAHSVPYSSHRLPPSPSPSPPWPAPPRPPQSAPAPGSSCPVIVLCGFVRWISWVRRPHTFGVPKVGDGKGRIHWKDEWRVRACACACVCACVGVWRSTHQPHVVGHDPAAREFGRRGGGRIRGDAVSLCFVCF